MDRDKDQHEEAYREESSYQGDNTEHSSQMNIQTNVNLTKKKRIIFWVYLITILGFLIAIAILSSLSWDPTKEFVKTESYFYASQVANDWKRGFIKDMKVFNGSTTSVCPSGYEDAVNFEWLGTSFGCYCSFSGNLAFVLSGYCASGLIQKGCTNIFSQPKLSANYWKNKGKICIQRSTVSFANEKKYDGTNKICGSSQSLIIVPSTEPCPFVNISFSSFSLQDHFSIAQDTNSILDPIYIAYNSTSPYSFYSYPVTKFQVSQYQFCQMDQDTGLNPEHSDFQLLNFQRGCINKGNFTLLDSTTELIFYNNNPGLLSLTLIDGFPDPGNWQYKFGFASINGWTYRCRHTYSNKFSITKALEQFNFTYLKTYDNFLIGVTVCLVIIGLQILVLSLRRIINNAVYPIGYRQKYLLKSFLLALSRYIIDFSAKLTIFALTLANLFTIYQNENWFRSAINLNCADNNYSTIFYILNPFMNLYSKIFKYAIATLVITVAMILVDIVHFIYIYKAELSFYIIQSETQKLVKQEDTHELDWVHQNKDIFEKDALFQKENPVKNQNEQFRITMAQNIFQRSDNDLIEGAPQKLKKKKKKKISPFKRKDDDEKNYDLKDESNELMIGDSLEFNPYMQQSLNQLETTENRAPAKTKVTKRKK